MTENSTVGLFTTPSEFGTDQKTSKGGNMKIYRQTERFVVFGLIVAFMVFGIQTSAEAAGVGPEPVGSCGEFDAGAPWIADIEFSWTVENGGTAKVFAKVNYLD